jgi:hypothetical protein
MSTQLAALIIFLTVLLVATGRETYGQRIAAFDSLPTLKELLKDKKANILSNSARPFFYLKKDSSGVIRYKKSQPLNPWKSLHDTSGRIRLKLTGGFVSYNANFRSLIDTPLLEKNILQHSVNGNMNLELGNLPLQVNYLIRRSNSAFFRDFMDVQVNFDVRKFQQKIYRDAVSNIAGKIDALKDNDAGVLSKILLDKYLHLQKEFALDFNQQKLTEARQMIYVQELSWDKTLPDSLAKSKSDSLRAKAQHYVELYEEYGNKLESVKSVADSLKNVYDQSLKKISRLQQLLKRDFGGINELKKIINDSLIQSSGIKIIPKKYYWLLGIRKLSIGRTTINHSELTAKNLSLKGINFEYSSRFYFAFTAGLVNYRFRDFNIQNAGRPKQYFIMGRFGVGDINKTYLIASLFNGTKQIFASGSIQDLYSVRTTGISLEGRYQFSRYNYLKAEIAKTLAPDFRNNPPEKSKWSLSDKTNQAYLIGGHFEIRRFRFKLDGTYKYTGANFQSFSSFQTNSARNIWNIKGEKYFFKKILRINAAIKNDEFSNPYLIQAYSSNTIFRSFQASFRKKKWPMLSAGYMPMTQLTNINGYLAENRFNSLNGTAFHKYNVSRLSTSTSIVYSRFYNSNADSGFIYFNAKNISLNQQFYFPGYTATINYYRSTNNSYRLNVMEESLLIPFRKNNSILAGVKIYSLERVQNALGFYGNIQVAAGKNFVLRLQWEEGYIPGNKGNLVKNRVGNFQLTKNF